MAIFELKSKDGAITLIVRAKCLSCARQAAVESSQATEVMLWRDPSLSTVKVIYNPEIQGLDPVGRRAIIRRTIHE